ncbi:MAG: hypothetical protein AAGB16_03020 [Pseudomonadota bacterium]
MKPVLLALSLTLLGPAACHHAYEKEAASELVNYSQIERFAIDAVYKAHPTRALVDKVETLEPAMVGRYIVNVEMTGAPTARKIYNVTVDEAADGDFNLVGIEIVQ